MHSFIPFLDKFIETIFLLFSIPEITSGDFVMMDRYMSYPYYFVQRKTKTHKNLVLFDESTATTLLAVTLPSVVPSR